MPVPPSLPEGSPTDSDFVAPPHRNLRATYNLMEALLSKVSGRIKSYELTCFRNCVKQTAWVPWPMTLTCCCTDPGPTMHFGHMCNCLLPDLRSSPSPPYRQNMQCLSSKYFDSLDQFFLDQNLCLFYSGHMMQPQQNSCCCGTIVIIK